MIYENVVRGRFLHRENRFLAKVERDGQPLDCHVKNTSRLGELLLPGVAASLQSAEGAHRKTAYDLIAVEHEGRWVNIDSQAANIVCGEWLARDKVFGEMDVMRREVTHGRSRFDYYLEMGERKMFVEVKGVTLVEEGIARFPGAPTLRGVKHVDGLRECLEEGYEAAVVFVVQRDDVKAVAPNDAMQPVFGAALRRAAAAGVQVLGVDCAVTPDSICARNSLEVIL